MCQRKLKLHKCPSCQENFSISGLQSLDKLEPSATMTGQAYFLHDWEDCLSHKCVFSSMHPNHPSIICACTQEPQANRWARSTRPYHCRRCWARDHDEECSAV